MSAGPSSRDIESQPPFNEPWFQAAYKSALQFYNKDDVLDQDDRRALSKIYSSIIKYQLAGGWLSFLSVFATPFAVSIYKRNTIKGVKVPRNFVLGLVVLLPATYCSGQYSYRKELRKLESEMGGPPSKGNYDTDFVDDNAVSWGHDEEDTPEKAVARRRYEMMTLLGPNSATRWASYFHTTAIDPERRLPNPEVKLEEMKARIRAGTYKRQGYLSQKDPMGLYSGPREDKPRKQPVDTIEGTVADSLGPAPQETEVVNSWDRVRRENLLGESKDKGADNTDADIFSQPSIFNTPESK